MPSRTGRHQITLNQFGAAALVGAALSIALGFTFRRREMAPHLYGGAAAILLEAALVVFVLDRLTDKKKHEEWAFVQDVVGRRMAACMVDILRLSGVHWSSAVYPGDPARYSEFVGIARLHFADLRSSIEGLALGAEPSDYREARKIELRIAWLIDKFGGVPDDFADLPQAVRIGVMETHDMVRLFLSGTGPTRKTDAAIEADLEEALETAAAIVRRIVVADPGRTFLENIGSFWTTRMSAQDELLTQRRYRVPGIWFDVDLELALGYFAIDSVLLGEVSATSTWF
jgi:hypothetical protein